MAEVRLLQPRPRACLFRIKRIFVPSSLSPGAGKVCASCSRIRATFTPTPRDRATLIPSYVRFAMRVRDGVVPSHAPVHVYVVSPPHGFVRPVRVPVYHGILRRKHSYDTPLRFDKFRFRVRGDALCGVPFVNVFVFGD